MIKALIATVAALACGLASAAMLDKEVADSSGMKKICIYSDGSTITMSSMSMCPLSK